MPQIVYQPKYTSVAAIKQELEKNTKVEFSNSNNRYFSDQEVLTYIRNAEGWVERQLSRLYIVPFVSISTGTFAGINYPESQALISDACTWKAVLLISTTAFWTNSGIRGDNYLKTINEQLNSFIKSSVEKDKWGQFLNPPMLDVQLNPNAAFYVQETAPMPMVATLGRCSNNIGIRALRHMNNPVNSWLNWYGYNKY